MNYKYYLNRCMLVEKYWVYQDGKYCDSFKDMKSMRLIYKDIKRGKLK